MTNSFERAQLDRELHSRALEYAVWTAIWAAQCLGHLGVDTDELLRQLTMMFAAVRQHRQAIEDSGGQPDGARR